MKERYVKPAIYIESFALSQSIAKYCEGAQHSTLGRYTHDDENTCTWDTGAGTLFYDSAYCNFDMHIYDDGEYYCYNNPGGITSLFAS